MHGGAVTKRGPWFESKFLLESKNMLLGLIGVTKLPLGGHVFGPAADWQPDQAIFHIRPTSVGSRSPETPKRNSVGSENGWMQD